MKKILIIFLFLSANLNAQDFKLEKIIEGLDKPWSLSFIDSQNLFVTENRKYKICEFKRKKNKKS